MPFTPSTTACSIHCFPGRLLIAVERFASCDHAWNSYRINQLPEVSGVGLGEARIRNAAAAVRHHVDYRHDLPGGSKLRVEWWILQDEQVQKGRRRREHRERLRPYTDQSRRYSQRVIAITRGGQTHSALTSNILARRRLRQVARSIVVQIDTDDLTWEEGASFFASNRADLKDASQRMVEEAINAAIEIYLPELKEIERERETELIAGRSASDEEVIRRHLDPMIQAFQPSQTTSGAATERSRRQRAEFRGREVPTYLRFAGTSPLSVRQVFRATSSYSLMQLIAL